jgi:glycosyltransferase involved in cell wall biosynthesis
LFVGFSGKEHEWWNEQVPGEVTVLRRTSREGILNDIITVRNFLNLDLQGYDIVLSSGPAAKFIQPYDDQYRIHYLHHPPLAKLWFSGGLFSYLISVIDRVETVTVPSLIANSQLTARRSVCHYNREVDAVIPPPVRVTNFTPNRERNPNQLVMVGRLEDRKRPEIAIEAMQSLPEYTLKLVGDGPRRQSLEREAPDNVDFLGYVDDETLHTTIETSVAALFLTEREDFGITPIEYMAAGTPVVGVDEPNTNNQIGDDVGTLVPPEASAVVEGIQHVVSHEWDHAAIRKRAEQYDAPRFRDEIQQFVENQK